MTRSPALRRTGIAIVIILRYIFGLTFLYGAYHKLTRGWMTSSVLREHFTQRLSEIDPGCFSAHYLRRFAIPLYLPIAWVLTLGQIVVALSMLSGKAVRPSAGLALFLLTNISAGAYFNASMPPYLATALLLMATPSDEWFGLDARQHSAPPTAASAARAGE